MVKQSALATLAIMLAACQPAPEDGAATQDDVAETPMPVEPDGGIGDGATPLPELIDDGDAGSIPAAFRGRWGLTANDCDPAQADIAKGLMAVSADRLEFYESVGTLDNVQSATSTRLVAAFDFTGEGQEWERDMTFELEDNGAVLVRRESGANAMPDPLRYERCPA